MSGGHLWRIAKGRTATAGVLAVSAVLVVTLAITATGEPVNHVSANDGGVWMVDSQVGAFAEMNVPVRELGSHFISPDSTSENDPQLGILQNGSTILAVDEQKEALYPVSEEAGAPDTNHVINLSKGAAPSNGTVGGGTVALGGGTVAILAPGTGSKPGKLWAAQVGNGPKADLSAVDPSARPLTTLVGATSVAVDSSGDVFVASSKALVEVPATNGELGKPTTTMFPIQLSSVELSTVGSTPIVLDPTGGTVYFPATATDTKLGVSGPLSIQQSGPPAGSVLVGTQTALLAVPLGGGTVQTVATVPGTDNRPAQPVALDGCDYGAWGGSPGYDAQACPDSLSSPATAATALEYEDANGSGTLNTPVFRVNNGFVVLNDTMNGGGWLVAGNPSQIVNNDEWLKVFAGDKPSNSNNPLGQTEQAQAEQPKLNNPPLAARAGQQSVLHLLDDDTDPNQSPLSITSVTPSTGPGYSIAISPDSQTVVVDLNSGATNTIDFSYSVIDGKGQTATGPVSVTATTAESPPAPLKPQASIHVVSGGTVSFGVLGSWRDPESDPITLGDASASAGDVSWTSDGTVTYTAPTNTSPNDVPVTLTYQVTDGRSGPVPQTQQVDVVGTGETTAYPAVAEPDVTKVVVGQSATISPLANDLFGADPADPGAKLVLAGQVASVPGVNVSTNAGSGQLTVDVAQPGAYLLSYQDAFGSAPLTAATPILIEAVPPPTSVAQPPVTTPISVIVHGTEATSVDVLTSDSDPSGGLLTVVGINVVPQGLEASIQQGEFVRVAATSPPTSPNNPVTQIVDYQVSDGQQQAIGQISVTEEPALTPTPPVVPLTYATVRAANEVDVPVLASASDPDGEPISLVAGSSGDEAVQLSETDPSPTSYGGGLGSGSVSGAYLRYEAPSGAGLTSGETITASFIVQAADGAQTTGQTILTVLPDSTADTQPQPVEVDARVPSGGTVTIPIPTTGVDPDGQDVTVTNITSTPKLGRVLTVKANTIEYQAYPLSSTSGAFTGGTDTFSYQVASPSGQTAEANIRVGVTPPSSVQPPVAIDHYAIGAPGSEVLVDLLDGDVIAPGDAVSVEPLSTTNHSVPGGARLVDNGDVVEVSAPQGATPLDLAYGITDGTGTPSLAHVVVRSEAHFAPAPVAADYFPTLPAPAAKSIAVNVLAKDSDPVGSARDLKVVGVSARHAVVRGSRILVPVNASPVAISYTIESGASKEKAVGVIYVPGNGDGLTLQPGTIHVPEGGSTTVNIVKYISDPAHAVRLTTTNAVQVSPTFGLTEQVTGNTSVKLTSTPGYQGPGSLIVQVTDASSLSAPGAHTSTFPIPVLVGNPTPIVRCPQTPVNLVQGGLALSANVASLCKVWTPDGASASSVSFKLSWARQAEGVNLSSTGSGRGISLVADSSANAGTTGQVAIDVPGGGTEASSLLNVQVEAAPLAIVTPVNVPGVETGHSITVDMSQYVESPLAQPRVTVERVSGPSQGKAQVSTQGSAITITPATGSNGTEAFTVFLTDQGQNRMVSGTITLQVLDTPSVPTGLQGVPSNQQVTLSWAASQPNGVPVDQYEVTMAGGGTMDTPGTELTWTGLQNGQTYAFTVRAHNQVGWSQESGSFSVEPKSVPETPVNVTAAAGNGQVAIQWTAPANNGQPILDYTVTVTPASGGPSSQVVTGTSLTWNGVNNNVGPYSFTVTARNALGSGPTSAPSKPVYAHAQPPAPPAPTAVGQTSTDQTSTTITVSWPEISPCNDAQPCKSYIVTEFKGGANVTTVPTTGACGGSSSQCTQTFGPLTNDGSKYSFELQAVNEEGDTSLPSSPSNPSVSADGKPGAIVGLTATPQNSSASVTFTLPPSHGASISQVDYSAVGSTGTVSGSWSSPGVSGATVTEPISGLTQQVSYSVTVWALNELDQAGPTAPAVSVTPYGSPQAPTVGASASGNTISYSWGGGGNGGLSFVYHYSIDGGAWSSASTGGSTSATFACGSGGHYISAYVTDSVGQQSGTAISNTASTNPCPQASVTISWGASAPPSNCGGDTSCRYINISVANFSPGTYTVTYYDNHPDGGAWYSESIGVNGNGTGAVNNNTWFGWGGRGYSIWAVVNGHQSNTISS